LTDQSKHGLYPVKIFEPGALAEARALASAAEQHDGIDLRILWSAIETGFEALINLLYYQEGRLVGFLTAAGLGDDEAEVTGMVHPEYRRRGIFGELVSAARAECLRAGTPDLLFTPDRRSASAKGFMTAIGARHDFAEHSMQFDAGVPIEVPPSDLAIARAGAADAQAVAAILAEDRAIDPVGFDQHIAMNIRQPHYRYYIARLGETPVGTLNIQILNGDAYVYGFVVRAEYRGRGYGRQLLAQIMAETIAERAQPIFLEVETENAPALGLYHSLGFRITHTFDYYRLEARP
jgi:ribosomal protein S18 acetylase RimI-like enzyme